MTEAPAAGGACGPAWRVLAAPVLDVLRPRRAAQNLVKASRPAFLSILVLSLLGLAAAIIGLALWDETVQGFRITPSTASGGSGAVRTWVEVQRRSVGEVWATWRAEALGGWITPAEVTLGLVGVLGPTALAVLAWLSLPWVHRAGPVWRSYKRAFRGVTGLLWPGIALTVAWGSTYVMLAHYQRAQTMVPGPFVPDSVLFLAIAMSVCGLAVWLSRATDALASEAPLEPPPPRCEGCGYDLTHQPAEARCPECGLELAASLEGERSRPGCRWSQDKSLRSWLMCTFAVLFRPRAFYRRLRLRTPLHVERGFTARHYVALYCGAALWATGTAIVMCRLLGPPPQGLRLFIGIMVLAGIFCGVCAVWLGQRVGAAVVFSTWLVRRELPDFGWARKIATYETAYLWVYCIVWAATLTLYACLSPWLSSAAMSSRLWLLFNPPLMMMLEAAALSLIWLWRYEIAYRAIRWSNF